MPTDETNSQETGILPLAASVLRQEAEALMRAAGRLGSSLEQAVALLAATCGRVVVTGMGKSAIIGQKIVATFNSTGTPALFMHAADALHGDLGMVQPGDVVIMISKSGDTAELKQLVPLLAPSGVPIVALVGNVDSYLGRRAAAAIDASVTGEACPNNLAPTTSTTVALAIGDAMAVCLMKLRGFTDADFARYHPGGTLGKRLYLRVTDLYQASAPQLSPDTALPALIVAITKGRMGAALIVEDGQLQGIVTDGDLRRLLERTPAADWQQLAGRTAREIASATPKQISADALAVEALEVMEQHGVSQLVVVSATGEAAGLIHLHDILKEGL